MHMKLAGEANHSVTGRQAQYCARKTVPDAAAVTAQAKPAKKFTVEERRRALSAL